MTKTVSSGWASNSFAVEGPKIFRHTPRMRAPVFYLRSSRFRSSSKIRICGHARPLYSRNPRRHFTLASKYVRWARQDRLDGTPSGAAGPTDTGHVCHQRRPPPRRGSGGPLDGRTHRRATTRAADHRSIRIENVFRRHHVYANQPGSLEPAP